MSIDYQRWRHALAMTESNDNPRAWGDSGVACGRYQQHPAFFWDYWNDAPRVQASWDEVFEQALRAFVEAHSAYDPVHAAMIFHLGAQAVQDGQWDEAYESRFRGFYGDD